jgi:hypothetical protein
MADHSGRLNAYREKFDELREADPIEAMHAMTQMWRDTPQEEQDDFVEHFRQDALGINERFREISRGSWRDHELNAKLKNAVFYETADLLQQSKEKADPASQQVEDPRDLYSFSYMFCMAQRENLDQKASSEFKALKWCVDRFAGDLDSQAATAILAQGIYDKALREEDPNTAIDIAEWHLSRPVSEEGSRQSSDLKQRVRMYDKVLALVDDAKVKDDTALAGRVQTVLKNQKPAGYDAVKFAESRANFGGAEPVDPAKLPGPKTARNI